MCVWGGGGGYCGNHNYYNYMIKVLVLSATCTFSLELGTFTCSVEDTCKSGTGYRH